MSNVYTQIVPKWIRSIANKEVITIYGDGQQTMDMIFGADIGVANVAALDNEECKNIFLNVGTGIQTSVFKLLQMIKYNMSFLMDTSEFRFLYEDHDP